MHRVERIEQRDETTLMWHENIWGVRRSWEAEITDQAPCERIAWRSKGGTQTIGVVTFHRLSDTLTRVLMTVDFQPKGLFEKTASGTRISRRAIKSDLMRFKAFVELRDEATGEWRGRIEDGELADEEPEAEREEDFEDEDVEEEPEGEADEDFEDEEEEPEAEADEEEPEAEADEDEPEAEEDLEPEDEEPEEEEEAPRGRRGRGRAADEDEEPDEEPDEEEPAKPRSQPRRRRAPSRRKATASSGRKGR
jgi:chemotaxis protein histidine kinase CheA